MTVVTYVQCVQEPDQTIILIDTGRVRSWDDRQAGEGPGTVLQVPNSSQTHVRGDHESIWQHHKTGDRGALAPILVGDQDWCGRCEDFKDCSGCSVLLKILLVEMLKNAGMLD